MSSSNKTPVNSTTIASPNDKEKSITVDTVKKPIEYCASTVGTDLEFVTEGVDWLEPDQFMLTLKGASPKILIKVDKNDKDGVVFFLYKENLDAPVPEEASLLESVIVYSSPDKTLLRIFGDYDDIEIAEVLKEEGRKLGCRENLMYVASYLEDFNLVLSRMVNEIAYCIACYQDQQ